MTKTELQFIKINNKNMKWKQYIDITPKTNNECRIIVGKICSGKNTFSKQFIFHKVIDISDIVRNALLTNERVFDKDLDKVIINELDKILSKNEPVMIIGIRQKSILDFILEKRNATIYYLNVPLIILEERFTKRNSYKDKKITFTNALLGDSKLGFDEIELFIENNKQNKQYSIEIINNY